jgi:hypothetical protein
VHAELREVVAAAVHCDGLDARHGRNSG